jgi:hypothetical protein
MPALVAGIHALAPKEGVDGRNIGERSDAVLRTAMSGHDERWVLAERTREVFGVAVWRNEPEKSPELRFGETNPKSRTVSMGS